MIMLNFSKKLRVLVLSLLMITLLGEALFAQDEWKNYVSVYDIFDDSTFGRSEDRDILLSVAFNAFVESDTITIVSPNGDPRNGYLTSVTFDASKMEVIKNQSLPLRSRQVGKTTIYRYRKAGIEFEFSLEKPSEALLQMISDHYINDDKWRDPVLKHYKDNYVIRIHSAENVFEPWKDTISYSEAMLMATLIGDREQWLWGIHDGNDLLFSLKPGQKIAEPGNEDGDMYDFKKAFKTPAPKKEKKEERIDDMKSDDMGEF